MFADVCWVYLYIWTKKKICHWKMFFSSIKSSTFVHQWQRLCGDWIFAEHEDNDGEFIKFDLLWNMSTHQPNFSILHLPHIEPITPISSSLHLIELDQPQRKPGVRLLLWRWIQSERCGFVLVLSAQDWWRWRIFVCSSKVRRNEVRSCDSSRELRRSTWTWSGAPVVCLSLGPIQAAKVYAPTGWQNPLLNISRKMQLCTALLWSRRKFGLFISFLPSYYKKGKKFDTRSLA